MRNDRKKKGRNRKKGFYRRVESIMRMLEQCEDTHTVFQLGMEMGYLHRSLSEELSKEIEPQERSGKG